MNLSEQTRKVLKTLTPREEKVLRMPFGIGVKSDHTLEAVSQDFEVTRERIRPIEARALRTRDQCVLAGDETARRRPESPVAPWIECPDRPGSPQRPHPFIRERKLVAR